MLHPKRLDLDAVKRCSKRKKQPKGIPIGSYRLRADPSDMREIFIEELMD
jgi:hypothetical protein